MQTCREWKCMHTSQEWKFSFFEETESQVKCTQLFIASGLKCCANHLKIKRAKARPEARAPLWNSSLRVCGMGANPVIFRIELNYSIWPRVPERKHNSFCFFYIPLFYEHSWAEPKLSGGSEKAEKEKGCVCTYQWEVSTATEEKKDLNKKTSAITWVESNNSPG